MRKFDIMQCTLEGLYCMNQLAIDYNSSYSILTLIFRGIIFTIITTDGCAWITIPKSHEYFLSNEKEHNTPRQLGGSLCKLLHWINCMLLSPIVIPLFRARYGTNSDGLFVLTIVGYRNKYPFPWHRLCIVLFIVFLYEKQKKEIWCIKPPTSSDR